MYDAVIIGAGVSGASIAWQLSRYDLRVALLERCADVCFGVSKANSGIVHGGFHHPVSMLKARLEVRGNLMFEKLQYELDFPFRRNGILVAAFTEEQMATVRKLFRQGMDNGVRNLEMCGRDRMLSLEPKLNPEVVGGFFAPGGGTVEPYRFVFSLVEAACRNGVELLLNFDAVRGVREKEYWRLTTADGREVHARYVINAAGLYADAVSAACGAEEFTITPRKGEEYLLDRESPGRPERVIFPVPVKDSKGVLVIPTAEGTTMIGPTAEPAGDKEDAATSADHMQRILTQVKGMIAGISPRDVIASFAGLRPVLPGEDFYIDLSQRVPGFVQVAGIQSPGLTAAPAIGEYVKDLLKRDGLQMAEKTEIVERNPPRRELRHLSTVEAGRLHREASPGWTNVICRCEKISEAEIVEAVRKGHTTLDGVKFYTRAGMGRCQGGFCASRILRIISRESGIPMRELTKKGPGSELLAGQLGDLPVATETNAGGII